MINLDAYLLEFISKNWLTISTILGALKILAKETETAADDKIITMLTNLISRE